MAFLIYNLTTVALQVASILMLVANTSYKIHMNSKKNSTLIRLTKSQNIGPYKVNIMSNDELNQSEDV